jgi:hypothetical protein
MGSGFGIRGESVSTQGAGTDWGRKAQRRQMVPTNVPMRPRVPRIQAITLIWKISVNPGDFGPAVEWG